MIIGCEFYVSLESQAGTTLALGETGVRIIHDRCCSAPHSFPLLFSLRAPPPPTLSSSFPSRMPRCCPAPPPSLPACSRSPPGHPYCFPAGLYFFFPVSLSFSSLSSSPPPRLLWHCFYFLLSRFLPLSTPSYPSRPALHSLD